MNLWKPKILCVDDEPLNLGLLEAILTPRGYDVLCAGNGAEALQLISREEVDVLLLDMMMPGMNGFEVCARVKGDERYRRIPVVMITAYAAQENRIRGIEAGAEDFISKPFDTAEVLARIGMLVRVKSLNDRLDAAYQNITSLTRMAGEIIPSFDPLTFDYLNNLFRIVGRVVARSAGMRDHPHVILLGIREAGGTASWYRCDGSGEHLAIAPLAVDPALLPEWPDNGPLIRCHNRSDPPAPELAGFTALLAHLGSVPDNLVVCRCDDIAICAVDYSREVSHHDAEVLNSVVVLSRFLKSLSRQVRETEEAFAYTVHSLARAAEANDEDTGDHILRVGDYGALLARQLGMPDRYVEMIRLHSQVHDVGKIHIPAEILRKPGSLTREEFETMKLHTSQGARILGEHARLSLAAEIALNHHERWDGSGYPRGLRGDQIPLGGRIATLADQYDALRNARVYKPAYDHDTTCRILLEGDGRTLPQHFDPEVLKAFRQLAGTFGEIYERQCAPP